MPMYDYRCPGCRTRQTIYKRLSQLDDAEECDDCGHPAMVRLVSAPAVVNDYSPYTCPITGELVEGRRAHNENLRRHGCRVLEPGERESMLHSKAATEAKLEAAVLSDVEATIHQLPIRKRESLISEVEQGLDVSIVRSTLRP